MKKVLFIIHSSRRKEPGFFHKLGRVSEYFQSWCTDAVDYTHIRLIFISYEHEHEHEHAFGYPRV